MARPRLGLTETVRMQLKITAEEIEAIDDWRFANRAGSRSEAVRQLIKAALASPETPTLEK
jgi:Arc/MetJ-type ribon-helix-helix transcriptional regulator